jgi:hypothetical protein
VGIGDFGKDDTLCHTIHVDIVIWANR